MPTDWLIGYIIGVGVVIIVAVLALILINQARKIGSQAIDILEALRHGRDHTEGLWEVDKVNRSLEKVRAAAREARMLASGGGQ